MCNPGWLSWDVSTLGGDKRLRRRCSMRLSISLSVSAHDSQWIKQHITYSYPALWYVTPVETGTCNVLVNKSFIWSRWTGSVNFTPCLYFHALELNIKSVLSHFTSCHICHALHWLIHINSRRPQPYTTAALRGFRRFAKNGGREKKKTNNKKKNIWACVPPLIPFNYWLFAQFVCLKLKKKEKIWCCLLCFYFLPVPKTFSIWSQS